MAKTPAPTAVTPAADCGESLTPLSPAQLTDAQLIARCLTGDALAWSEFYDRFHQPLQAALRAMYHGAMRDANLVDEISARVWYLLVRDDFKLLRRFDPDRGVRFTTYLSVIAKSQARQHFRSERRRTVRETIASKPIDAEMEITDEISPIDFETIFLESLTKAERQFFDTALTSSDQGEAEYSPGNTWQLRHRILEKLREFLAELT